MKSLLKVVLPSVLFLALGISTLVVVAWCKKTMAQNALIAQVIQIAIRAIIVTALPMAQKNVLKVQVISV